VIVTKLGLKIKGPVVGTWEKKIWSILFW